MEFLQTLLQILNWLAVHFPWGEFGASTLLSGFLLAPKKWIKKHFIHNEQVMIMTVFVASLLVVAGQYLMITPTTDPSVLAIRAAVLAFMTQPVYYFIVKPIVRQSQKWIAQAVELKLAQAQLNTVPTPTPQVSPPAIVPAPNKHIVLDDFTH